MNYKPEYFNGEKVLLISTKRLNEILKQLDKTMGWTLTLSREWKQAKQQSNAIKAELRLRKFYKQP